MTKAKSAPTSEAEVNPTAPVEASTEVEVNPTAPVEASTEVEQSATVKKGKVTGPVTLKYLDHEGKPVERTFSAEVHGENFADLAEEFKKTNASRIVNE